MSNKHPGANVDSCPSQISAIWRGDGGCDFGDSAGAGAAAGRSIAMADAAAMVKEGGEWASRNGVTATGLRFGAALA